MATTVPSIRSLTADFDAMTHGERVRRMADLGKNEAGSAALARLLDALALRSAYECRLAMVAAAVSGDQRRITAALEHSSARVRSFASSRLLQVEDEDDILGARLLEGNSRERYRLGKVLYKQNRSQLAGRLIEEVRTTRGDREAATLLGACGEEMVRRLLPELDYCVSSWPSLARRHPDPVLDHFEVRLRAGPPRLKGDKLDHKGSDCGRGPPYRSDDGSGMLRDSVRLQFNTRTVSALTAGERHWLADVATTKAHRRAASGGNLAGERGTARVSGLV